MLRSTLILAWQLAAVPALAQGQLPCTPDDTLSDAAAALLLAGAGRPTPAALAAAARDAGSDLPSLHALDTALDDDRAAATFLTSLRTRSDAPLVCGEAASATRRLLLAAPRAGSLDESFAVDPEAPRALAVRGSLTPGFTDPVLAIRDAAATLVQLPVTPADLARGVALPPDLEAPAFVQLVARGPAGPRPVAERIVPAAARTSFSASSTLDAPDPNAPDLPAWLSSLRERAIPRASALRPNRRLAELAHTHATAVCREARIAHELTPGADPEARLRAAGLRARVVGEAISRGADVDRALAVLSASPSHHATLVDRRFTDAGIGQAHDAAGRTCLVVLLAAWPRAY